MIDNPPKVKEMQQCFGPTCDYNALYKFSATGLTWKELQEYRENNMKKVLALRGITEPTTEMLLDRPVPTYTQFKEITSKEVKR